MKTFEKSLAMIILGCRVIFEFILSFQKFLIGANSMAVILKQHVSLFDSSFVRDIDAVFLRKNVKFAYISFVGA